MPLWEYKVITSGKGGFASPVLLEKFLNDLGREEWEIVHFQTLPENFLAFTGLARRSTQRDWTLEDAAAAAAKAEAEKLRAEFEAKFKAASSQAPAGAEERAPSFLEEKVAPDDGFRKPVDTSRDDDPEADDDKTDDWDKLTAAEEEELPTFFDAIKPHMRRNQRGPGMSVGVDYLAKKWDQNEDDLKGALAECGFVVPADEDSKVEYLEYDGDLYWLNINRRGELWINTKEKPRPVFRSVKAARVEVEAAGSKDEGRGTREAKPEAADKKPEPSEATEGSTEPSVENGESKTQNAKHETGGGGGAAAPLPEGTALLDKIRPHMRRNRRGPGGSGSSSFLARALRTNEADLKAAFARLGLTIPAGANDEPVYTELGDEVWWINLDSRGGLWINGREKRPGETLTPNGEATGASSGDVPASEVAPSTSLGEHAGASEAHGATLTEALPASEVAPVAAAAGSNPVLTGVRLLLKETKAGAVAAKIDRLAEELGKSPDDFIATLVASGFKVPEKAREKPVFVEHAGEILWLNKNAKGELWLNAKASKFASKDDADENEEGTNDSGGSSEGESDGDKKPRRGGRSKKKEE